MNKSNVIWWVIFALFLVGVIVTAVIVGNRQTGSPVNHESRSESEILTINENDNETNPGAPITIIEYSDFQCPACASYAPILKDIISSYEGQVNLVYRHFPLRSIHPNAQIAAQAAEAAGLQGKFFEMHDLLFENQSEWSKKPNPRNDFTDYAEQLGLDTTKFRDDLNSAEVRNKVNSNYADAMNNLGLRSTPSFFIDGQLIPPGLSGESIKEIIDTIIAQNSSEEEQTIFEAESLTNIQQ